MKTLLKSKTEEGRINQYREKKLQSEVFIGEEEKCNQWVGVQHRLQKDSSSDEDVRADDRDQSLEGLKGNRDRIGEIQIVFR